MTDLAISVSHLSKRYRLGAGPAGRGDFREAATAAAQRMSRWLRRGAAPADAPAPPDPREIWALHDVSFEVPRGKVVGIIGHNGAGKSTLLKILARVVDPSDGHAWYEGRVGSLLEVGTGFHPELSGRENIFLNGAILGMSRREIQAKFDRIVDFSEIGSFLDTPVKRYSSGMYVRLAFAVAAHLEPEILILDEVLAVGDARFQRKCMDLMKDVSRGGRTILFVSHNMGSIQALCDWAIVLSQGRLIGQGPPFDAVKLYLQSTLQPNAVPLSQRADRKGRGRVRVVHAAMHSEGCEETPGLLIYGRTARVCVEVSDLAPDLTCKFTIYSQLNGPICRFTSLAAAPDDTVADGKRFVCEIPDLPLVPGEYRVNLAILSGSTLEDYVEEAICFQVEYGTLGGRPLTRGQKSAIFAPRQRWILPANAS